jgi:hypothetical protein
VYSANIPVKKDFYGSMCSNIPVKKDFYGIYFLYLCILKICLYATQAQIITLNVSACTPAMIDVFEALEL